MKQLDEMKWECFLLEELFGNDGIEHCKCSNVSKLKKGSFPYVGATTSNNGIIHYVEENTDLRTKGNCIAFICDGDGSIGLSMYKEHDFIGSTTVKVGRAKWLNRYTGMFFTSVADLGRSRYSFGYKRNDKNLKLEHIMLPVSAPHTPDYAYMEEYMRNKEKEMLTKYKKYLDKHSAEMNVDELCLDSRRWKEFFLEDIFFISSSIRLTKDDMKKGKRPFVGASDSNNGVTAFVGNTNNSLDRNVLGVNYNGSVVENFYHPYEAIFSDDVKRLHLKEYKDDKYVFLFIKQSILMQKCKYEYGYKFNGERMKRQKIMLPITSSSTPDYAFMAKYMKGMELKQLKAYIDKRLNNMD